MALVVLVAVAEGPFVVIPKRIKIAEAGAGLRGGNTEGQGWTHLKTKRAGPGSGAVGRGVKIIVVKTAQGGGNAPRLCSFGRQSRKRCGLKTGSADCNQTDRSYDFFHRLNLLVF